MNCSYLSFSCTEFCERGDTFWSILVNFESLIKEVLIAAIKSFRIAENCLQSVEYGLSFECLTQIWMPQKVLDFQQNFLWMLLPSLPIENFYSNCQAFSVIFALQVQCQQWFLSPPGAYFQFFCRAITYQPQNTWKYYPYW